VPVGPRFLGWRHHSGNGFFKSNISTMVGQLYQPGDRRRDPAFTIFYMGINTGAAMGPIICAIWREQTLWLALGLWRGWGGHGGGLVTYLLFKKRYLPGIGEVPAGRVAERAVTCISRFRPRTGTVLPPSPSGLLQHLLLGRLRAAGSSMNFFAKERTELHFLGIDFLAPYFQSVNPIAIVVLAPVFAWMWGRLGRAVRAEHAGQVRHC